MHKYNCSVKQVVFSLNMSTVLLFMTIYLTACIDGKYRSGHFIYKGNVALSDRFPSLKEFSVHRTIYCASQCRIEPQCKTFEMCPQQENQICRLCNHTNPFFTENKTDTCRVLQMEEELENDKESRSDDINECANDPCENNATCVDLVNGYRCECLTGFTDKNCSTREKCKSRSDIVFLLDESGSVGSSNFLLILTFVKNVVTYFYIGKNATQISLVTFESNAREIFTLARYQSVNQVKSAITNVTFHGGGTDIGKGLNFVRQNSFSTAKGARDYAANVVILITDGRSSISNEGTLLKAQNVTTFCVGLGSGIDSNVLKDVSSDRDNNTFLTNFEGLNQLEETLATRICATGFQ